MLGVRNPQEDRTGPIQVGRPGRIIRRQMSAELIFGQALDQGHRQTPGGLETSAPGSPARSRAAGQAPNRPVVQPMPWLANREHAGELPQGGNRPARRLRRGTIPALPQLDIHLRRVCVAGEAVARGRGRKPRDQVLRYAGIGRQAR